MPKKQRLLIIVLSLCAVIAGNSVYQILKFNQRSDSASNIKSSIQNNYGLIGQTGPDFELPDLRQVKRSLSEWRGKTLIINFWATWCAPCRKEIPDLIKIQSELANQGTQVLGIAIDRPEMVYEFAQEYKINYPILHGEHKAISIAAQYGNNIGALPYTVLLDKQGIIRIIHDQGVLTQAEIKNMLAEIGKALD